MRLLIALVVWIGAVAGAVEVSAGVAHSIHDQVAGVAASGIVSGSNGGSFDASSVGSTDPRSLFRTSNFARALTLARMRLGAGARLETLALYPGYLDVTAIRAGSEVDLYIPADGGYTQTNTGGSAGASVLFSFTQVSASVPAALARRIGTSGRVRESQLNYMVAEVDPADKHFRWLVYPRSGTRVEYFQASGATAPLLEYLSNSSTGLQPVGG
jgi:hypothetical protein